MKRTTTPTPAAPPTEAVFLNVQEVATRYGVTSATIWSWIDKGILPQPIRFSYGTSRWRLATLKEWDAELETETAPRVEWEKQRQKRKRLQGAKEAT